LNTLPGALRLAPDEFAREMRIAAAVQWYSQGKVSQEKASELADLSRMEFLEELRQRKVSACQLRRTKRRNTWTVIFGLLTLLR